MNPSEIHVAFAFDENYFPHGCTTLLSLIANAAENDKFCVYVIDTGLSETSKSKIISLFGQHLQLSFLSIPISFFEDFPTTHHPRATYARLALAQTLPHLDKILYLDSDLVVLDSLKELWQTELSDWVIAASPDAMTFFRGDAINYWRSLRLPAEATYFNAGVLLLNLKQFREENILSLIQSWIRNNKDNMPHSDQSALNAVLWNHVKILDIRWNFQATLIAPVVYGWGGSKELYRAFENPGIVHFTTNRKPWLRKHRVFMANQYWKYRSALGWESTDPRISISDLLNRICEEITHQKNQLRTYIRWLLGKIPKSD